MQLQKSLLLQISPLSLSIAVTDSLSLESHQLVSRTAIFLLPQSPLLCSSTRLPCFPASTAPTAAEIEVTTPFLASRFPTLDCAPQFARPPARGDLRGDG